MKKSKLIAIAFIPAIIALIATLAGIKPASAQGDDYTTSTTESTTTTTAPVPQSLLNLQVNTLCIEGTSMIEVIISNDSHLPVSVDIIVDDEPRTGFAIEAGQAIYSKWDVAPGSEGTVATTVTYYDGGQGIFNPAPVAYEAINCPIPTEIGEGRVVERDDAYVSPPSTVPAPSTPKLLSLAG